jgi:hypothetical protein
VPGGLDELTRVLDNFYTTLFERTERHQNRRTGKAVLYTETDPADNPETEGAFFQPMVPRAHGDLLISGADQDADPSIFKITSGTGRVRYGAGFLDETILSAVVRLRMDFNSPGTANHSIFTWENDVNNGLRAYWDFALGRWRLRRYSGGVGAHAGPLDSFVIGDKRTLSLRWAAASQSISIDGAAFVVGGAGSIPTVTATEFDLLSIGGSSQHMNAGLLWALVYTGELTNAQVAALHALGDTDPTIESAAIQALAPNVAFIWPGTGAQHTPIVRAGECNV